MTWSLSVLKSRAGLILADRLRALTWPWRRASLFRCNHVRQTLAFPILLSITLAHNHSVAPAAPAPLDTACFALKVLPALTLVVKFPYRSAGTDFLLDLLL